MSLTRWFIAFVMNVALSFFSYFLTTHFGLGNELVLFVPIAALVTTATTWFILTYQRTGKEKRGQHTAQLEADIRNLEGRLDRLETIAAADFVNEHRQGSTEIEDRLTRLETIAAAEHLSEHPETMDQVESLRKRGMN
ncbi:MAG: hypothetical protein KC546_18965 [Anaerolineae bacterium]|nr:hypothetical protein [Anaerolineae bacterium]MCA9890473.1 hypothetical protein [Anaerolineae bacterium]MCA9893720.1 hypothetical protein [Anaerolineae bacterium]MCB9458930.1 hypothetical protein [Anaerolineaceae bacterium]